MVWEQMVNNVVGGLVSIKVMETGMHMIDKTSKKTRFKKSKKSSGLFSGDIPI